MPDLDPRVQAMLEEANLAAYIPNFRESRIEWDMLADLDDHDIVRNTLGIKKFGARCKIMKAVAAALGGEEGGGGGEEGAAEAGDTVEPLPEGSDDEEDSSLFMFMSESEFGSRPTTAATAASRGKSRGGSRRGRRGKTPEQRAKYKTAEALVVMAPEVKFAIKIQAVWRGRQARKKVADKRKKVLAESDWVKLYDPNAECPYWYNQTTGKSSYTPPPQYWDVGAGAAIVMLRPEVKYALRIQSAWRAREARRAVEAKKEAALIAKEVKKKGKWMAEYDDVCGAFVYRLRSAQTDAEVVDFTGECDKDNAAAQRTINEFRWTRPSDFDDFVYKMKKVDTLVDPDEVDRNSNPERMAKIKKLHTQFDDLPDARAAYKLCLGVVAGKDLIAADLLSSDPYCWCEMRQAKVDTQSGWWTDLEGNDHMGGEEAAAIERERLAAGGLMSQGGAHGQAERPVSRERREAEEDSEAKIRREYGEGLLMEKRKTLAKERTCNPQWDQTLWFRSVLQCGRGTRLGSEFLRVAVWDKDTMIGRGDDDPLGECSVDMETVLDKAGGCNRKYVEWFPLERSLPAMAKVKKMKGEIMLGFEMVDAREKDAHLKRLQLIVAGRGDCDANKINKKDAQIVKIVPAFDPEFLGPYHTEPRVLPYESSLDAVVIAYARHEQKRKKVPIKDKFLYEWSGHTRVSVNGVHAGSGNATAPRRLVCEVKTRFDVTCIAEDRQTILTYHLIAERGLSRNPDLLRVHVPACVEWSEAAGGLVGVDGPKKVFSRNTGPNAVERWACSVPNRIHRTRLHLTARHRPTTIAVTPYVAKRRGMQESLSGGVVEHVVSGVPSRKMKLHVGDNVFEINTTSQDGAHHRGYRLTISRLLSPEARLKSLRLAANTLDIRGNKGELPEGTCTLKPKFNVIKLCDPHDPDEDARKHSYRATVPFETKEALIAASLRETTASMVLHYYIAVRPEVHTRAGSEALSSGQPSKPQQLAIGTNLFQVVVTAQDGQHAQVYELTVEREGENEDAKELRLIMKRARMSNLERQKMDEAKARAQELRDDMAFTDHSTMARFTRSQAWVEVYDSDKKMYYYLNTANGTIQWEKPDTYVMEADDELLLTAIRFQSWYRGRLAARTVLLKRHEALLTRADACVRSAARELDLVNEDVRLLRTRCRRQADIGGTAHRTKHLAPLLALLEEAKDAVRTARADQKSAEEAQPGAWERFNRKPGPGERGLGWWKLKAANMERDGLIAVGLSRDFRDAARKVSAVVRRARALVALCEWDRLNWLRARFDRTRALDVRRYADPKFKDVRQHLQGWELSRKELDVVYYDCCEAEDALASVTLARLQKFYTPARGEADHEQVAEAAALAEEKEREAKQGGETMRIDHVVHHQAQTNFTVATRLVKSGRVSIANHSEHHVTKNNLRFEDTLARGTKVKINHKGRWWSAAIARVNEDGSYNVAYNDTVVRDPTFVVVLGRTEVIIRDRDQLHRFMEWDITEPEEADSSDDDVPEVKEGERAPPTRYVVGSTPKPKVKTCAVCDVPQVCFQDTSEAVDLDGDGEIDEWEAGHYYCAFCWHAHYREWPAVLVDVPIEGDDDDGLTRPEWWPHRRVFPAMEEALRSVAKAGLTVASAAREIELRKRVEVAQNRERSARLAMKYEEDYVRMVVVKRRQRYLCKKVFTRLMMGKTVMGFTKWVEVLHYSRFVEKTRAAWEAGRLLKYQYNLMVRVLNRLCQSKVAAALGKWVAVIERIKFIERTAGVSIKTKEQRKKFKRKFPGAYAVLQRKGLLATPTAKAQAIREGKMGGVYD